MIRLSLDDGQLLDVKVGRLCRFSFLNNEGFPSCREYQYSIIPFFFLLANFKYLKIIKKTKGKRNEEMVV